MTLRQLDVRLVTWPGGMPGGDYDSRPLLAALHQRRVRADIRAWNDPDVDWSAATLTVIRSTWDYHEDLPGFLDWTDRVATVTDLHNPPRIVRWNTDKRYLLELENTGIPIVPTFATGPAHPAATAPHPPKSFPETLPGNALPSAINAAAHARGWSDVVLKPAVSLDGHGVYRATVGTPSMTEAIDALQDAGPLIVQPFMPRITTDGELSLAFIDGRFSHAVRKRPAPGEFRVQERLGGNVEADTALPGSIEFAVRVLGILDSPPLYARVDIMEGDTAQPPFLLTELELVEPSLFLDTHAGAAATFADAIAARIER